MEAADLEVGKLEMGLRLRALEWNRTLHFEKPVALLEDSIGALLKQMDPNLLMGLITLFLESRLITWVQEAERSELWLLPLFEDLFLFPPVFRTVS